MENGNWIDGERCGQCGRCVAVCPAHILYWTAPGSGGKRVDLHVARLHACIACGHCMAVCPNEAMHVAGLSYGRDIFDLERGAVDGEFFPSFLASRRSIRVFEERPVPRQVLQRIINAISMAPMGLPPHKVEVTVVQSRETIEQALPIMVETLEKLARWMRNPFMRLAIRRHTTPEAFNSLQNHVLPAMAYRLPAMKAGEWDTITRGAPAMILFHAHREAESHVADAWIALTYGLLAAHALGLGATAINLVPPIVDRVPALRALFHIPLTHEVVASMVLGYPAIHFGKQIRRDLAGVHWL